jgi:hypothetical protein
VLADQLELAQVRAVGERDRVEAALLALEGDGDVPAVALLDRRARGDRLALHRAARDRARRGRQEVQAHERSTSPSGS